MFECSLFKDTAFKQYLQLVSEMDTYETTKFKEFLAKGIHIANRALKKNILRLERTSSLLGKSCYHTLNSLYRNSISYSQIIFARIRVKRAGLQLK